MKTKNKRTAVIKILPAYHRRLVDMARRQRRTIGVTVEMLIDAAERLRFSDLSNAALKNAYPTLHPEDVQKESDNVR